MDAFELQAFPAVFARVLGAMVILPISQSLSNMGKIFAFSFALSLFFLGGVKASVAPDYYGLIFEFMIGLIISLPAAMTVDAVRSLGELFDNQRGVSFATFYDPNMNQNASVMSHLAGNFSLVLILSGGILESILMSLNSSFELFPIYTFKLELLPVIAVNMVYFISFICAGMFKAFLLCALLFVLVDVASVFLSKVLNQTGLNNEVFLAKTVLGFLLLISLLKVDLGGSLIATASPKLELLSQSQ